MTPSQAAAHLPKGPSLFDRFLADGITRSVIGIASAYSFYGWWTGEIDWGWPVFWGSAAVLSEAARSRIARIAPFLGIEVGKSPALHVRLLGHGIVAWPITLAGIFLAALRAHEIHAGIVVVDSATMISLAMCLVPAAIFGRWNAQRHRWRRSCTPTAKSRARTEPTAKQAAIPVVRILRPASFARVTIPEAMLRLSPALLDLVRDGAARVRAQFDNEKECRR